MAKRRWWIIAYDIKQHRRLGRVHRLLKKQALAQQRSVFLCRLNQAQLDRLLTEVSTEIDCDEDDVRVYPLRSQSDVWWLNPNEDPAPNNTKNKFEIKRWLKSALGGFYVGGD